jgi:hypothetical protein
LSFVFSKKDCFSCELRKRCSLAKHSGRTLTIYPQAEFETLIKARERQKTLAFIKAYGQ